MQGYLAGQGRRFWSLCKKVHAQFNLEASVTYYKFGDLAKCMATVMS